MIKLKRLLSVSRFCLIFVLFGKLPFLFAEELWHRKALPPPLVLKDIGHRHTSEEGRQIDIEIDSLFGNGKVFQKNLENLEAFLAKPLKNGSFSFLNKRSPRITFHKVRKGESVWSISTKYDLRPSQVLEHNFKIRRRPLYIGEKLAIPSRHSQRKKISYSRKKQKTFYHSVTKGETLYGIAKKYKTPVKKLIETNKKGKKNRLEVGERLKIVRDLVPSVPQGYRYEKRFRWPLQGKITSGFGFRRSPFSRRRSFHKGIDIAAKAGTPIKAIEAGIVMRSRRIQGYGNCVFLLHPQNYISVYAHNSRNLVRKGQLIPKGKVIALVGRSGSATGPHLHFEIRKLRRPLDPIKAMKLTRLVKNA